MPAARTSQSTAAGRSMRIPLPGLVGTASTSPSTVTGTDAPESARVTVSPTSTLSASRTAAVMSAGTGGFSPAGTTANRLDGWNANRPPARSTIG